MLAGVSLSAQIGTLPFTLMYFNKFSIIALFTNLIVIPTIGFIIATAVVTLTISSLLPVIAIYFATANDLITKWTLSLIKFSGDLSFSHVNIYNYTLTDLILFYLMLVILIYYLPRFKNIISKIALFGLVAANVILYSSIDNINLLPENYLNVFMIDVGQGDSFLYPIPEWKNSIS